MNDTAEEDAVGGDAIVGGRRAEIDDDTIDSVDAARRQRVDDAVRADGHRLVDGERDAQLRPRIDDDGNGTGEAGHRLSERARHAGHHRAERTGGDALGGDAVRGEEVLEQNEDLVGRAIGLRGDPPVIGNDLALAEPEGGLGVANIDDEQHRWVLR